ncbi:low affinity potassium transporter [Umbelopsis nana]
MFLCFFFSACYYFDPHGVQSNYIDALFMMVSTSTCTGLNTVTITDMSTYQQSLIFISSIFGSTVFVNCVIVFVRKNAFENRFKEIVEYNRKKQHDEILHRNSRFIDLETGLTAIGNLGRRLSQISMHQSSEDLHPEIRIIRRPSILEDLSAAKRQEEEDTAQSQETSSNSSSRLGNAPNALKNITPATTPSTSRNATPSHSRRSSHIGSIHPLDTDAEADDSESTQTEVSHSMLPATDNGVADGNIQTIMFADDIDSQRERARNLRKRRTTGRDNDYVHRNLSLLIDKEQLTQEERFNLGGAEYRALHTLSRIVPLYYFLIPVICAFIFRIYFAASSYGKWVLDTSNGSNNPSVDPWYMSFFSAITGFNNVGLLPLDDSVVPFQKSPVYLLTLAFLILAGNTAFALLLRVIIWALWFTTPQSHETHKDSLRFLLDHPRRCFTTLFPSTQSWWLFLILFAITITELVMFVILNYWLPVVADISWGYRVLDGFFQSVSTRNAGFSVVNVADVNPGLTVVYVVAMYISVYPVTISMRRTNVYQERSLGIYGDEDNDDVKFTDVDLSQPPSFVQLRRSNTLSSIMTATRGLASNIKRPDFFVMQQIQRQLSSDMAWIVTGIFLICVIESGEIMSTSPVTVFSIIYECVSAFANVGASLGYPNTSTSQAAQYHTLKEDIEASTVVDVILSLRNIILTGGVGITGLPAAIDRAVLLPSEQWQEREHEDLKLKRRQTAASISAPSSAPRASSSAVFYRSRTM